MKRGTPDHPKSLMLQAELGQPRFVIVGVLESLWHFTARYAPQGDVGKYPTNVIAQAIGWVGDADELIEALVKTGWIDRDERHGLVVHDWADHADDTTDKYLRDRGLTYADGRPTRRRPAKGKGGAATDDTPDRSAVADKSRRSRDADATCRGKPAPAPSPSPEPAPKPEPVPPQRSPQATNGIANGHPQPSRTNQKKIGTGDDDDDDAPQCRLRSREHAETELRKVRGGRYGQMTRKMSSVIAHDDRVTLDLIANWMDHAAAPNVANPAGYVADCYQNHIGDDAAEAREAAHVAIEKQSEAAESIREALQDQRITNERLRELIGPRFIEVPTDVLRGPTHERDVVRIIMQRIEAGDANDIAEIAGISEGVPA